MSGFLKKWTAGGAPSEATAERRAEALRRSAPPPMMPMPISEPQGPRHRAAFAQGVRVEIEPDDQGRWYMTVTRGWARERVKNFCTPFAAHAARTAEAWFGMPVEKWEPEIEE